MNQNRSPASQGSQTSQSQAAPSQNAPINHSQGAGSSTFSILKHETGTFLLIHNLSFPSDNSVNSGIDISDSQVVYDSIDTVISLVKHSGSNALMAKTDITNAFHLMPIHVADRSLLGFTWLSSNGSVQYFMDC